MPDELKQIYGEARKSDRFFDKVTPCELWRAQSGQDYKKAVFIMEPHPVTKRKITKAK